MGAFLDPRVFPALMHINSCTAHWLGELTHINAATIQNSEPIKGYERSIKMCAADVMVTNVITVRFDTSVRDIAEILLANRISAVPVLDKAGNMVGIVSEGDLIHRV
ncbi:MAG: CBS domain-containing protein, partial [Pseudolabrys sp.]